MAGPSGRYLHRLSSSGRNAGLSVTTLFGSVILLVGGIVLLVGGRYIWRATAVLRAIERETLDDVASDLLV